MMLLRFILYCTYALVIAAFGLVLLVLGPELIPTRLLILIAVFAGLIILIRIVSHIQRKRSKQNTD